MPVTGVNRTNAGSGRGMLPAGRVRSVVGSRLQPLGPFRLVAELVLLMMAVAAGLRIALAVVYVDRSALTAGSAARMLMVGMQFDALVSLVCALPIAAAIALAAPTRCNRPWARIALEAGWSILLLSLPLLCVAEFLFFGEFDSRLNYIAFEYLVYPTEVCCNIGQSYPVTPLILGIATVGGGLCWALRRRFLRMLAAPASGRMRVGFAGGLIATAGGLMAVTDLADCQVSPNRVANECALNGVYSFAFHAWTCRFEFDHLYVTMDRDAARVRLRTLVRRPGDRFDSQAQNPLDRVVSAGPRQQDYNIVLILEESLGADYVGVTGCHRGLTPCFDALTRDGILFDNFYATGNRTARALEAVLTSLPPIPTESILKRDCSDRVYTLANVLEQRGYERLFMTGGRGKFDGVRKFMTANGFNRFVEQKDYANPAFTNAWGVSDEDLFQRALQELDALGRGGAPFFATLLTVSNHRPFTYPDGRIDLPSSEQTRDNAVKYADWALGRFFEKAKQSRWYRDTVFVVMGDHGARVYGEQLFPMKSYRVPALLILPGGEGAGTRCSTLGCSLDVAPTILGALGGEYPSVFFGRDIRALAPHEGHALMQHNHDVAMLEADREMVVLGSGRRVSEFRYDPATSRLQTSGLPDGDDVLDTIAFFQSAYELYYERECYPLRLARLRDARPHPSARGASAVASAIPHSPRLRTPP